MDLSAYKRIYHSRCIKCDEPILVLSNGEHLLKICSSCQYIALVVNNRYMYFPPEDQPHLSYTVNKDGTVSWVR